MLPDIRGNGIFAPDVVGVDEAYGLPLHDIRPERLSGDRDESLAGSGLAAATGNARTFVEAPQFFQGYP